MQQRTWLTTLLALAASYIIGLFFSTGLLLMLGLILRQVVATRKAHSEATAVSTRPRS